MPITEEDAKRRVEMANGLRQLADVVEQYGGEAWPLPYQIEVSVSVTKSEYKMVDGEWTTVYDEEQTRKNLRKALRGMGKGRKEKKFNYGSFEIVRDYGGDVLLKVHSTRAAVCKKVPTGNKIVHEAHTYTQARRVEEEYEWECTDGVLLKGAVDLNKEQVS